MNTLEIKNKFDQLLKQLSTERSFDVAEKITTELVGLLNIKTTDRFLVNIPRVDAELTRFQLAPGFARQAAAYELPHEDDKPIDFKLFWVKKASKTNLSWLIGLTPNFEDALSNDYKNIGIDFVVPESCDSIIVLLSNKFKIRALELKDHITPTQLEIFTQWAKLSELEIADQAELKNTLHSKLWESFNFEPINRKFYLELVEHFSILVHHLEKYFGRKQSVMFTTRLIGRLLFIWFLKKKNLVNNNVNYFSVTDPEKQSEYYKNQLEKLFFEVLNREELERDNGDKLTPYLNGGLFDKNTTDFFNDPKLTFPNGYFNQLFTTLNKYNFTVDESSPEFQHVAIDPEMLGRIFESLLAEQIDENTGNSKKKATGAFYTPREIVSYMCEQSLIEYLKTKVPEAPDRDRRIEELVHMPEAIFRDQDQNKRRDWKPYREAIIKALEGSKTESALTVLDPAVGSGAFPMGMLHLLVKVYSRLDPKFEKDISGLKRDILSRSLYGVDIEQTAIEITRLRAWLSIIVDIPEGEKVEPLPNLEFKFVCANTLIPLDNTEQATFFTDHDLKDKLITIRNEYFKTSSKIKKEKLQKDYLKLTQNASLFDNKKTQQLKSYKPFDISSSSEFYDPELMHGVQSFDIVIGNPPYFSIDPKLKRIPLSITGYLRENYVVFSGLTDILVFFYERSFDLLNKNGILTFITKNRWHNSSSYKNFCNYLSDKNIFVLDFDETFIFKEVGVTTNITLLRKNIQPHVIYWLFDNSNIENIFDYKHYNKFDLIPKKGVSWDLMSNPVTQKMEKIGKCILYGGSGHKITPGEYFKLKKISDNIYEPESNLIKSKTGVLNINGEESKYIYPFASSGDIFPYLNSKNNRYIINLKNAEFDKLDNIKDYFNKIKDNKSGSNWYEYHNGQGYRNINIISRKEKIVFPGRMYLNRKSSFLWDDNYINIGMDCGALISNNSSQKLKYILGILNSKLGWYFIRNKFKRYKGRQTFEINKFPVAEVDDNKQKNIIEIVDQILTLKKQNKDADTKNLEAQIDQLVYKLYGLTEEEIKIVEESTK